MPKQLTQAVVEEWIALTTGKFNVRDGWAELGIESLEGKKHFRIILSRCEQKGVIANVAKDGSYRKLDTEVKALDWQGTRHNPVLSLKFPFGLEQNCRIRPKNIIALAGEKNAGKTGWLYNFVSLNMNEYTVDLFSSEAGPEQIDERMAPLNIPVPAPFNVYERYENFADVIHPDHISVIDYLDFNSEVYLIGGEMEAMFRKLNKGIAVIGIQKPPGRDLGYGGIFSAKKAALYISMGANRLKLLYVKVPANPKINPSNMTWSFGWEEDGIHFKDIQRYYGDQQGGF